MHKQRRTRGWVRKGVGRFSATMTPDELARFMAGLDARTNDIVADGIRGGWFQSREAHSVDALIDLARPDSAPPAGPDTMVHVVVDYDALVRGHTVTGETCEIPGVGPIPVSVARYMSEDAILKVLITKGVDVVTVAHAGYTIPAHLRSALDVRPHRFEASDHLRTPLLSGNDLGTAPDRHGDKVDVAAAPPSEARVAHGGRIGRRLGPP